MNDLEKLQSYSTVVADTSDFQALSRYCPQEATTNPSLILQAIQKPEYQDILRKILKENQNKRFSLEEILNLVQISFGKEILKIIPGRVSTEIDPRSSFDTQITIEKALALIELYEKEGIKRERVLIKIAGTWEGIEAIKELKKQGIQTNLTLIFSMTQANAASLNGATLISPFVGRVYDWNVKKSQRDFSSEEDPGVLLVKNIYHSFKNAGRKTEIMAASFRNRGQIESLSGCDFLTISLKFLSEFSKTKTNFSKEIDNQLSQKKISSVLDEKTFRDEISDNKMASECLKKGIEIFCKDIKTLETLIQKQQ